MIELPLKKSKNVGWIGPNGANVPTVGDLISALQLIEDKSLPVSVIHGAAEIGGTIAAINLIKDDDEHWDGAQVNLVIENIWI